MRVTMGTSGRLVIPKPIRDAAGLEAGQELEISERDGRVEMEVARQPMHLVDRDGFLAAEVEGDAAPVLTAAQVRELLEHVRR